MKNTGIATLLALLIPTLARAASPESFTINVNDRLAQEITVEQAEPAVFTVTFMDGASPYDLNGKVPFMFWSKSATIPPTVRASFSVVSITGGVVQFSFTAADLNLTNGTQTAIYGIGVQNYPQTVARGRFRITPNPYSSGAGDIPWATNVMWGTIPWVGMPIFLTNLHSAGQSGSGGVVVDAGGDATITFPAEVDPIFTNSDVFGITHADRVAWSNSVIRSQTNESDIAALRQDLANETAARTNADASIRHDLGTDVSSLGLSLSNAVAGVLGDVSALSSDTVHRVSGSGRISASGTTNVALTFDASGLATTGEVASVAQAAGQAYSVATNALDIAQQAAAASIDQTARDGVVAVGLVATNALNIALAASNRADSAFSVATNATLLASNAFAQGSSAYTIATNALQKAGDASNVAASAYLTATNAAALATQAQAHADSAYLYATNAEAVALAAYPASNPSNFITSSEVRAAMSNAAMWGAISGDITTQTDLVARLDQISENLDNAVSDLTNQLHGISLYTGLVDVVMSGDWYSPEFVKGINLQPVPRSAPSSNEVVDLVDMRVLRQYSDQVAVDWQLSPESLRNRHDADLIWSVLPTNKASVSSNGFLTSLASGVVTVRLDVGVSSESVAVPASLQMDLTVDWQLPGATNYLRYPLVNGLYQRATNGTQSMAIMQSFNHAQTSYVYATTGLLAGVDLSPFPVRWSRWGTRWIGGALITSNIVITTHHLRPLTGDKVWFLTTNNVVVEREVVEQHYFAWSNSWVDVALSRLDSPVTEIEPVHAPPPTWGFYVGYQTPMPDQWAGYNLPVAMIDQFFNAHIATLGEAGRYTTAVEPWFSPYYKIAISGDSGSPLFFMAGNTPVLIGAVVMNTWKPGMGNLLDFRAKIEEGITALSPGATLNYFDPTGYTPLLPLPPGGF